MKYKLLKDLPDVKAGAVFERFNYNGRPAYQHYYINTPVTQESSCLFAEHVENNPEWFAPLDERWKPMNGQLYYIVNALFKVDTRVFADGWDMDVDRHSLGNCFRTQEDAEAAASKVRDLLLSLHKDK